MNWKKLVSLALALMMLLTLVACGGGGSTADAPADDAPAAPAEDAAPADDAGEPAESAGPKTLTVGTIDTTDTFDPCTASACRLGLMLVYDTVLRLDYDTMELVPSIATDWEYLDDTTLKLTIRDDAVFSNGDVLTPSDVLYSLGRFVFENDRFDPGYDNIDFDNCTIDGNVLTLKLYNMDADFLDMLANDQWASVVCEAYVKANPDAWWDAPCGTGPYICNENVEGSHSSYTRRDDYWGDLPDAETITIRHYSESTTMIADFENHAIDLAIAVPEDDYLAALDGAYGDDVETALFPTFDVISIQLPEYNPVFDDIRVRQAIAKSINYETFTNAVYGSLGTVADSMVIPGMTYYTSVGVHEYDPEGAKELLAEAGYADGMDMLLVIPSTPANEAAAVILQAFLSEIGIKLTVESYDFPTAIPILMRNGTDISIGGTGGATYLTSMLLDTISQYNTNGAARVTDPEFNGYLDDAASGEPDMRAENYANAQQWIFDNCRTIPIAFANSPALYHNNISHITGLIVRSIDLERIHIN